MGNWWVPGLQIGYEHSFVHQVADFLEGVAKGKPAMPDFRDALRTQLVCDAVLHVGEGREVEGGCHDLMSSGWEVHGPWWTEASCIDCRNAPLSWPAAVGLAQERRFGY